MPRNYVQHMTSKLARGECKLCPKKATSGQLCDEHRKRHTEYLAAKRKAALRPCAKCGTPTGKRLCKPCAAKERSKPAQTARARAERLELALVELRRAIEGGEARAALVQLIDDHLGDDQ